MSADLLARLEKATGPDRGLFVACYNAILLNTDAYPDKWRRFADLLNVEAWTDAALMLFPDRYAWELYSDGSGQVGPEPKPGHLLEGESESFEGATPALGICIAAMKARAGKE